MDLQAFEKMGSGRIFINEFLALMFENTAEDGTLYLPEWYYDDAVYDGKEWAYRCQMDWDIHQFEHSAADFYRVCRALRDIAPHLEALDAEGADPAAILQDEYLQEMYALYCAPLDAGDFDRQRIQDIGERIEILAAVDAMKQLVAEGLRPDEKTLQALEADAQIVVTEEERAYYENFRRHREAMAAQRMGPGILPYDAYIRGHRLCRLFALDAPNMVVNSIANVFAAAFMLHRHGISRDSVPLETVE